MQDDDGDCFKDNAYDDDDKPKPVPRPWLLHFVRPNAVKKPWLHRSGVLGDEFRAEVA